MLSFVLNLSVRSDSYSYFSLRDLVRASIFSLSSLFIFASFPVSSFVLYLVYLDFRFPNSVAASDFLSFTESYLFS